MTGFITLFVVCAAAIWILLRRSKPKASPVLLPQSFVVFDLETTGLHASKHEIIEIGAVRVDAAAGTEEHFQMLVKPRKKIPKKIRELTGITQQMVDRDGVALEKAMAEFTAFIEDLPLVAFNAEFDMAFLNRASGGVNNRSICALEMSRRAWPGLNSYKLVALSKARNLAMDDNHRALGDSRRTLVVYRDAVAALGAVLQ